MRRQLVVRALAPLIERRGDLTHAFGSIDAWHFLKALGRRPLLLTVALPGRPLDLRLYERVRMFAAQTDALASKLQGAGVTADRIVIIPPGVDVNHFSPAPPPEGRFRVVFASTPADPREFEPRGIPLLIEAARACPEVDIVLLWRQWGPLSEAERIIAALSPPANLILDRRDVEDMSAVYRSAHATVCCFDPDYGKSAPNSIIEGLASGRPALLSEGCGLAARVESAGAGVVVKRSVDGIVAGLEKLRAGFTAYSRQARQLAEAEFDERRVIGRYGALYERLTAARPH
jgi:glycosyltransferase involved in cell wall biosynthesis